MLDQLQCFSCANRCNRLAWCKSLQQETLNNDPIEGYPIEALEGDGGIPTIENVFDALAAQNLNKADDAAGAAKTRTSTLDPVDLGGGGARGGRGLARVVVCNCQKERRSDRTVRALACALS